MQPCKYIYSLLILSIVIATSCKKQEVGGVNSFTVSGDLSGLDTDFMIRSYRDDMGNRVTDSIPVKNGQFEYTAEITEPSFIFFWPQVEKTIKRTARGYFPAKSSQLAFIASPGDNIFFEGKVTDFIDAYPSGTTANNDLAKINRKIFPLLNKSVNLMVMLDSIEENHADFERISDSIDVLSDQVIKAKIEFVNDNPNSEAAAWYLSDMMMRKQVEDERALAMYNNLGENLLLFPYYKEIKERTKGIESTLIGKKLPNYICNTTLDDTRFEFNSLGGKFVLIDFWGTWCGPCVAEMPRVKQYQEKYFDKLTVIGINNGDTKDEIISFTAKHDYAWTQLMDGKGNDRLALKFNISGYPTKFILDPNGIILYRFTGSGDDAFDLLDELLLD